MAVFISKADPKRDSSALAPKLWALWMEITDSVYVGKIPARFTRAVAKALDSGYLDTDLMNVVHYSSYLTPTSIASDVTRVARVMEDFDEIDKLRALAVKLSEEGTPLEDYMNSTVQYHPQSQQRDDSDGVSLEDVMSSKFVASVHDTRELRALAKKLGIQIKYWTEYEYAFAIHLLEMNLQQCTVSDAIDQTRKDIGQYGVLPSDLVRTLGGEGFTRELVEVPGEDEDNKDLDATYLQLDSEVVAMLQSGEYYYDDLLEFHHQVPEGYWVEVSRVACDLPDLPIEHVYSKVSKSFAGFTPNQRGG